MRRSGICIFISLTGYYDTHLIMEASSVTRGLNDNPSCSFIPIVTGGNDGAPRSRGSSPSIDNSAVARSPWMASSPWNEHRQARRRPARIWGYTPTLTSPSAYYLDRYVGIYETISPSFPTCWPGIDPRIEILVTLQRPASRNDAKHPVRFSPSSANRSRTRHRRIAPDYPRSVDPAFPSPSAATPSV